MKENHQKKREREREQKKRLMKEKDERDKRKEKRGKRKIISKRKSESRLFFPSLALLKKKKRSMLIDRVSQKGWW